MIKCNIYKKDLFTNYMSSLLFLYRLNYMTYLCDNERNNKNKEHKIQYNSKQDFTFDFIET